MDPTKRSQLPPEIEQRVRQVQALDGEQRAAAIQQLYGEFPDYAAALAERLAGGHSQVMTGGSAAGSMRERLRRLEARSAAQGTRYELHGELARGGMGAILRAYDQDLGRPLAMKVMLAQGDGERSADGVGPEVLERFIEEAQVTGQLDHPGVVPVHELGLDQNGRVYFTMRLVKGVTAQEVFARARLGTEGWTLTRALEVLLKVCDTLAYAHSKGVVHRDLKPSNVMVGKYGEVYVMDWGLAKVLGQPETRDVRIRPPESTSMSRVRTDRSREHESDPDTALRTMDGAIVGTPCYMPPEQAHGHIEDVGVRSDVYAVGAMLYTLLTGTQPYIHADSPASPYMVLEWVRNGPPKPIQQLDRTAPVELVAVCEHAMAREVDARYPGMRQLADDLRAFLDNRIVRAYRTGARAELLLWVRRNRGMALALVAAMLAVVLGGVGALVYARQADLARQDTLLAKRTAEALRADAEKARGSAEQALADLREQQRQKEELESILEQQRSRQQWQEQQQRQLAERHSQAAIESQNLQTSRQARLATLQNAAAQLRTLARLLPADAETNRGQGAETVIEQLVAQVVVEVDPDSSGPDLAPDAIRESIRVAWQHWMHGRCLLHAGQAETALPLLQDALANSQKGEDDLLQGVIYRALADACSQSGRSARAVTNFASAIARLAADYPTEALLAARDCATLLVRCGDASPAHLEMRPCLDLLDKFAEPAPERWIHHYESGWTEHQPAGTDIGARRLRGVLRTLQGHLTEGLADLHDPTEEQAGWLPMLAMNQRLRGQLDDALMSARRARLAAPDALSWQAAVLEEVRALRAVHRPDAGLALLAGPRPEQPGPDLQPILQAELLEAKAACQADLTRWDEAQASLAAALALLPAADASRRDLLQHDRAELLLQIDRADEAIAALTGASTAAIGEPADLPLSTLLRVAMVAEHAGRVEAADSWLAAAASRSDGDRERVETMLLRMRLLHGRGHSAEAATLVDSLRTPLAAVDDAWLEARALVQSAEVLAASDRAGDAMSHLDRAARAIDAWLRAYSRFQAELSSPTGMATLETIGQSAIATLIRIAPQLTAADTQSAWCVLETFRALPSRLWLTRPAALADAIALVPLCTNWRRLTALTVAPDPASGAERHRLTTAVHRQQRALDEPAQQLRERMPMWCSATLPRIAALADIRQLLPTGTALVVFAAANDRAIAFVATRTAGTLVPLPLAENLSEDVRALANADPAACRSVLARLGRCLVDPVLAALADSPPTHTLLLAPVAELCAVPFELCITDGTTPLIAHRDVAYVPSGTACYDRMQQRPRPRPATAHGIAMIGDAARDRTVAAGWITAALQDVVTSEADRQLLGALAQPEPDRQLRGPCLDLLAGTKASATALRDAAARCSAIALSLELEHGARAPHQAALACGEDGGEHPGNRLTPQDLRDLQSNAEVALLRNCARDVDPVAESQAMPVLATGLWSGGAQAVITVGAMAEPVSGGELVRAFLSARRDAGNGIAAFCEALRRQLASGSSPVAGPGVRLWYVGH